MSAVHTAALIVVLAVLAALWIVAVVSILRVPARSPWSSPLWLVGTLVFPVLGPLAWFLVGRPARRRASTAAAGTPGKEHQDGQ